MAITDWKQAATAYQNAKNQKVMETKAAEDERAAADAKKQADIDKGAEDLSNFLKSAEGEAAILLLAASQKSIYLQSKSCRGISYKLNGKGLQQDVCDISGETQRVEHYAAEARKVMDTVISSGSSFEQVMTQIRTELDAIAAAAPKP